MKPMETFNCSKENFDSEISARIQNNILLDISARCQSNWLKMKIIIQNWFRHKAI